MFRLESISPPVVAWAVSLGFGGLLLMMFLSGDPPSEQPPAEMPVHADRPEAAAADPAAREPQRRGQDVATAETSVAEVVPSAPAAETVLPDKKLVEVPQPRPRPVPPEPPDARVAAEPKQPEQPAAPKPNPAPRPVPRPAREIEAALTLPIVRYVHQKPVAVLVVIREIEQLGGVDVRLEEGLAGDSRLERTVQLDLDKTTVGGILDAALEMVGLTRRVQDGYVLIVLPVNGADPRGTR